MTVKSDDKDIMIQEIDRILEEAPLSDVKRQMNHRVEDFIYNASLLERNLSYGMCNKCEKSNINDCEKCNLFFKKQELYEELKRAKRILKRNKNKDKLFKITFLVLKCVFSFIIVVIALFGITFDSISKKLFYDCIPCTAVYLREQQLKCLHVDFTREYIENELGKPKSISEIQISNNSYFRTIYTDKYYTLLCYYNDIGSLLGYMIIGNSDDFKYQFYRSDIKILEDSVSEARRKLESEGIQSEPIKKEHFESDRMDNNMYYYECKMQHSREALETCYIGFGFTDIGYHSDKIEPDMDTEKVRINFITVFEEYSFNEYHVEDIYDTIDFINDYVITATGAGISKGELTNLSEDIDFNEKINEYLDDYQK